MRLNKAYPVSPNITIIVEKNQNLGNFGPKTSKMGYFRLKYSRTRPIFLLYSKYSLYLIKLVQRRHNKPGTVVKIPDVGNFWPKTMKIGHFGQFLGLKIALNN